MKIRLMFVVIAIELSLKVDTSKLKMGYVCFG